MSIIKGVFSSLATVALCIMLAASCNAIGMPITTDSGSFIVFLLMCLGLGWKVSQID